MNESLPSDENSLRTPATPQISNSQTIPTRVQQLQNIQSVQLTRSSNKPNIFHIFIYRLEDDVVFRTIFFVVVSICLFFSGVIAYVMKSIPYSITTPLSIPTKFPDGFEKNASAANMFARISFKDKNIFYRAIVIVFSDSRGKGSITYVVRKNHLFSCDGLRKEDSDVISVKEITDLTLGSVCIDESNTEDGTVLETYTWVRNRVLYSIEFPKGAFSREEFDMIASSIEKRETTIACRSKIFCLFTSIGLMPAE